MAFPGSSLGKSPGQCARFVFKMNYGKDYSRNMTSGLLQKRNLLLDALLGKYLAVTRRSSYRLRHLPAMCERYKYRLPDKVPCMLRKPIPEFTLQLAGYALLFLMLFFSFQYLYQSSRGTRLESLLIDQMTVAPSAALISSLTPDEKVMAQGRQLVSPHVHLSVLNGCEGTETILLLAAAILAFGMSWRRKLLGIIIGGFLVYLVNQLRIAALYYCVRFDPPLFEALHGYIAPVVVIAVAGIFFLYWVSHDEPRRAG